MDPPAISTVARRNMTSDPVIPPTTSFHTPRQTTSLPARTSGARSLPRTLSSPHRPSHSTLQRTMSTQTSQARSFQTRSAIKTGILNQLPIFATESQIIVIKKAATAVVLNALLILESSTPLQTLDPRPVSPLKLILNGVVEIFNSASNSPVNSLRSSPLSSLPTLPKQQMEKMDIERLLFKFAKLTFVFVQTTKRKAPKSEQQEAEMSRYDANDFSGLSSLLAILETETVSTRLVCQGDGLYLLTSAWNG
ncbi:hypothetical protein BLNAU_3334 [Blattamonas nauphoetae]|uniref:Uncharacterized protein n=1 Tax=Blattamonas nauphoetae TaxID=2049346 RepID=A0ABQ9YD03_9EUKA|nr:hypothetical protein BLNAU_3334 [Blattamonas nauphoetae]